MVHIKCYQNGIIYDGILSCSVEFFLFLCRILNHSILVKMFFFSFCLHGTSPVIGDRCGALNQPQDVFFNDKLIFFVCLLLKSFIRHPILLSNCKSFLWHSLYLNSFLPAFLHRKLTFKLMILFFLFALQISLTAKRQSKIQSKNLLITISKNHGN